MDKLNQTLRHCSATTPIAKWSREDGGDEGDDGPPNLELDSEGKVVPAT